MKLINNITEKLGEDLKVTIKHGDRLSIAAATFSVYAFEELKEQLEGLDELRFIFTSPTFLEEKPQKAQREFYIPQLNREKTLHGSEFEIRLRNDLSQRAISLECARWIKEKVRFKSNTTMQNISGFIHVNSDVPVTYAPVHAFTRSDLGCERGENMVSMIQRLEGPIEAPMSQQYLDIFNMLWNDKQNLKDVTDKVLDSITNAFKENSPEFLYFFALYNIFGSFLEDVDASSMPNEALGFKSSKIWSMLYTFQKDAVLAIISKLEQFNGCILADSVGLGKTFTALAVIKYYELRNLRVLVLCPKKLSDNWRTYKANYVNNPIAADRLRYDVLYHTDLSRNSGYSGEIDLSKLNWSGYDLVVIDESHNFRNGGKSGREAEMGLENRYDRLMNKVIKSGARTRVLMLSATPVNNRFYDLRNQLALAYEGESTRWKGKLNTTRSMDDIFSSAQKAFNDWNKLPTVQRTTEELMRRLDFDFFEVLDAVTIARSRRHIEKYYNVNEIGRFPTRLTPVSKRPPLTDLPGAITYQKINDDLVDLKLCIYAPTLYIFDSAIEKYEDDLNLTQSGREQGLRTLMRTNLLKRLESSVDAFRKTLTKIRDAYMEVYDPAILRQMEALQAGKQQNETGILGFFQRIETLLTPKKLKKFVDELDLDADDQESDLLIDVKGNAVDPRDMDYLSFQRDLGDDLALIDDILSGIARITPERDSKLQTLLATISEKIEHPINPHNQKILIFTAFADTAVYLYDNVSTYVMQRYGLHTALITGTVDGRSTVPKLRADYNNILTCFSPLSKNKDLLLPDAPDIDILIATDCISEGQNLQDCDCVINYDIHWNPVRLVQRFGRIDRIGSQNDLIQMINFWPDMDLDTYLQLKKRVESRMKAVVMTSTGDDNLLSPEEKGDLEYRRKQLEQLQHEIVDLEDMGTGVSITDLGLTEFRMELMDYANDHPELETTPGGISAVTAAQNVAPSGVVFVLKNVHNEINMGDRNRLHPYYLVYLSDEGDVVYDHLSPRDILETMRQLCRGRTAPIETLYQAFNQETSYGENMQAYSSLLEDAVLSIIDAKADNDLESLFHAGGTTALLNQVSGLDDFELICFLVVKEAE